MIPGIAIIGRRFGHRYVEIVEHGEERRELLADEARIGIYMERSGIRRAAEALGSAEQALGPERAEAGGARDRFDRVEAICGAESVPRPIGEERDREAREALLDAVGREKRLLDVALLFDSDVEDATVRHRGRLSLR